MYRPTLWLALTLGVAAGCAPQVPNVQISDISSLHGTVTWADRAAQALPSDIANGATVSLIDTTTSQTVGTTVTQPSGSFNLNFGSSFRPVSGRPYYLEAVRGLGVGLSANRAGASLARIRTILFYEGTSWKSLTASGVNVGPATTAVAAIVSLRGLSVTDQGNLMAKVSGASFSAAGTAIGSSEFSHVYGLVTAAISADQDPLEALHYDSAGGSPATQYLLRDGSFLLHDSFTPAKATGGGTATFYGQNLPLTDATVSIGGIPVSTWSVNATRTQLNVTLGASAYSGHLTVTKGGNEVMGPFVPVSGTVGTFAGAGVTGLADGRGTMARFNNPGHMAWDSKGNLWVADRLNHMLRKITPAGTVTTVAGNGAAASTDGTGTQASFNNPVGLAIDASDNVYVAERQGNRIRKMTPSGVVTTLAGGAQGFADGTGTSAMFWGLQAVKLDAAGNLYAPEYDNHRIRKISPAGVVTTLAGNGATGSVDAQGTNATFQYPVDVALDAGGNLFVADCFNHKVRKIDPAGNVTTFVGSTQGYLDATGTAARLNQPSFLEFDASGNLYMTEYGTPRLRKITPAGVVTSVAGTNTQGILNGPLASAQFYRMRDLAIDPAGTVFVDDMSYHLIRAIVL